MSKNHKMKQALIIKSELKKACQNVGLNIILEKLAAIKSMKITNIGENKKIPKRVINKKSVIFIDNMFLCGCMLVIFSNSKKFDPFNL